MKVLRFHGFDRKQLKRTAEQIVVALDSDEEEDEKLSSFDIMVTTYEAFLSEKAWLRQAFVWKYLVLDEGHKIKNDLSSVSQALQGINCEHRLLISG